MNLFLSIENKFKESLKDRLGEKIDISLDFLEEIPLGVNAKFKAVKRLFKLDEFIK